MRQKYSILLGDNENELVVKESGELDKGIYTNVFEQKYDRAEIQAACNQDETALISALRTHGFYPVTACAEALAKGVKEFFEAGGIETKEISFNDISILRDAVAAELDVENEDDTVELDKLLEDESNLDDETILEDDDIKTISPTTPSLKVADDDSIKTDDDK